MERRKFLAKTALATAQKLDASLKPEVSQILASEPGSALKSADQTASSGDKDKSGDKGAPPATGPSAGGAPTASEALQVLEAPILRWLYVRRNPRQTFNIDFYRLGWYGGTGGRLIQHVQGVNGLTQPSCPADPITGLMIVDTCCQTWIKIRSHRLEHHTHIKTA